MKYSKISIIIFIYLILFGNLYFSADARMVRENTSFEQEIISYLIENSELKELGLSQTFIRDISLFMRHYLEKRAESRHLSLERYLQQIKTDKREFEFLISKISDSLDIDEFSFYSAFFNFNVGVFRKFLNELIKDKVRQSDLSIKIKSVAGNRGMEAYTAAMVVYDRLERYASENLFSHESDLERKKELVKDWIKKWDIEIAIYDVGLRLLEHAKIGDYFYVDIFGVIPEGFPRGKYEQNLLQRFFIPYGGKRNAYQIDSLLHSWVREKYIDLTDEFSKDILLDDSGHEIAFFISEGAPYSIVRLTEDILKDSLNSIYSGLLFFALDEYRIIEP